MMTNRILFLLLILPYMLSQNVGPTILYISSSPDSVVAPVSSSLAGGTLIYLKAIGHNPMPSQNSIMVGSFPCIIPADGVIDTFISCYTTDSKSNLDISNLPVTLVSYSIPFTTSSPNLVNYAAAVTPQLTEVFPSVGWANRTIYFLGIHQISDLGDGRSMGDVVGLRIGSDLCSLFDIVQGSINPATAQYIQCIQSSLQVAGRYNITEQLTPGYARNSVYMRKMSTTDDSSFEFIVLPAISSVSTNSGNLGGQNITISGFGFSPALTNNTVTVDGNTCKIQSATQSQIVCILAAKNSSLSSRLPTNSSNQTQGYFSGGGLFYARYSIPSTSTIDNLTNAVRSDNKTFLKTVQEVGIKGQIKQGDFYGTNYGQVWRGYFNAPTDGNYTFRGLADNLFALYINPVAGSAQPAPTPLIFSQSLANWNNLFIVDIDTAQNKIYLNGGQSYYMQVYHINSAYAGNIKIAVDVPNNNPNSHSYAFEVQKLMITSDIQPEVITYSMVGGSSGTMNLKIVRTNPTTGAITYNANATVAYGCTAATFLAALNLFNSFSTYQSSVERFIYDSNNNTINTTAGASRIDYVVSILLMRPTAYQTENFIVSYAGYTGIFVKTLIAQHSPTITGTFSLTLQGKTFSNLANNVAPAILQSYINQVPGYENVLVDVTSPYGSGYSITWIISFRGVNHPVTNITVNGAGLIGGKTTPNISLVVRRPYSSDVTIQPLDARFLSTSSNNPNILVQTNGLSAICLTNCSYSFLDLFQITSLALTSDQLSMVVSNTNNLQVPLSNITIKVQGLPCSVAPSSTLSNLVCTLTKNSDGTPSLVSGSFTPQLYISPYGFVGLSSAVSPLSAPLAASSLYITSGGNNGGYYNTLTGVGLPFDINLITISVCSSNAKIISSSNTQVKFYMPACPTIGSQQVAVTIGSLSDTSLTFSYTATASIPTINSLSPTSSNPALKKTLVINGNGFGTNSSLVEVFLANSSGKVYALNVLSVNETCIVAGLSGGLAGVFQVQVTLPSSGGDSVANPIGANTFQYQQSITSVTPNTGSYNGGTLLTITGTNFSPASSDTLVYIGDALNWFCNIESITTTQITCRTPPISESYASGQIQIVVVSTNLYVFNTCPSNNCNFTYMSQASSPTLTSYTANSSKYTLSGFNFVVSSGCSISLVNIADSSQTYLISPTVCNNNSTQFILPSSVSVGDYFMKVRNEIGQSNANVVSVKWIPGTADYSVGGSRMGTIATFTGGSGYPSALGGSYNVLLTSNSAVYPVKIIQCCQSNTLKILIPETPTNTSIKIVFKGPSASVTYNYTSDISKTPTISLLSASVVNVGLNTIGIKRTDSLNATTTSITLVSTIDTNNVIVVSNWTTSASDGSLTFVSLLSAGSYKISVLTSIGYCQSSDIISVSLPASITMSNRVVSYAGGKATVTGQYLSPSSYLRINSFKAPILTYNQSYVIYSIPPLITQNTQTTYNLAYIGLINTNTLTFFSDVSLNSNVSAAFDSSITTIYGSSNTVCYIGMDVGEGLFASIDRIRFFPFIDWKNTATYLLGAVFQGSNDKANWTVLGKVDQTIHSGWNIIKSSVNDKFRYIRFRHNTNSNCNIAEIQLYGIVFSNTPTNLTSQLASPVYNDGYNSFTFNNTIEFRDDRTPIVYSVNPPYGDTFGGYSISLLGNNLNFGAQQILIDSIPCVVTASNRTQIICTVGARPNIPSKNEFSVWIDSSIAKLVNGFLYVLKWSDKRTWGTDLPPIDGDLVYVPAGMTLLIDQNTPILQGIAASNGTLIFPNDTDVTVRAGFITVNGGSFIAGTQSAPLYSNLKFVMYGEYEGKQQPMFGNKGIGCLNCKFSLYGRPRSPVWTVIAATVYPGNTTVLVNQDVDWQVGQMIAIASTSSDHTQSQKKTIVSKVGRLITVDTPFKYQHISVIENYGASDKLQMRAEIGLLSRNIKMMGDDSSVQNYYGSHLMLTSTVPNGLQAQVAYTQFTQCGQPKILGRYCIHFHMAKQVPTSYVRGNAVHQSYARIVTIHGVQFLTVQNNIGYRVKGHNFFIQDGIETHNVIRNNLAISSLAATNMMQTDTSVASFWVTNPTNDLIGNHAAGGDFYGFWYQIKPHPDGPSASNDICPVGYPLGIVRNNTAHSNIRFGLRILQLFSRTYPCLPVRNNSDPVDPWKYNPSIPSTFYNFTLYKNMQDGVLCESAGNIVFQNFTVAQNYRAGVQFYAANGTKEMVSLNNSVVIGQSKTNLAANKTNYTSMAGVITPRTGSSNVTNTRFYNFPNATFVFVTCSKCNDHIVFTNLGTEVFFKNLTFTSITGSYLLMLGLKRDVIYDLDASLSLPFDNKSRTSATIVWSFNHLSKYNTMDCPSASNTTLWDSALMCNQNITIRRVFFTNILPLATFSGQNMKAMPLISLEQVIDPAINASNYTTINGLWGGNQPKIQQMQAWSLPFITGKIYQVWWGTGLDFTHVSIVTTPIYSDKDDGIIFKFNYTANREIYNIGPMRGFSLLQAKDYRIQNSVAPSTKTCLNGEYIHNNDNSSLRLLAVCQSGKNRTRFEYTQVNSAVCNSSCPAPAVVTVQQNFTRLWSNASMWPNARVPLANQNVTVNADWVVLLDVDPAPANYMIIDGVILIDDTRDVNITARSIFIRAGNITAGSPNSPFKHKLTIQITNTKTDNGWYIDPLVAGNKYIIVTGSLNLYGEYPATTKTTLTQSAFKGDTLIYVANNTDWVVGDTLALSPSYGKYSQYELVNISSININGSIGLSSPLQYNHYGSNSLITSSYGQIDVNTYVGHMNRNIKIVPGPDYGWGVNLLVYGYMDGTTFRTGIVNLYGVQIQDGGQYDTLATSLQFLNIIGSDDNSNVVGSTLVNCKSWCISINNAKNIVLQDNILYNGKVFGVQAVGISQLIFENNLMIGITSRTSVPSGSQLVSCFATFAYINPSTNTSIRNNFCLGSQGHGFAFPHIKCNELEVNPMANNTAGSCQIGFIFTNIAASDYCKAFSYINAYACQIGQICSPAGTTSLVFKNFILADNQRGATLRFGNSLNLPNNTAFLSNSYITAVSRPNCLYCYGSSAIPCTNSIGVRMLATSLNGESLPGKFGPLFDIVCKAEIYQNKAFLTNVTFDWFQQSYTGNQVSTVCRNNFVFRPHSVAWDKTGDTNLISSQCSNCDSNSFLYAEANSPNQLGWFGGCGDILCTGKSNYLVMDWTGSFLGYVGTLIPNNTVIGSNQNGCTFSQSMNAHSCNRSDFGLLAFQSTASDFNTRIMWPINLTYQGSNYTTIINGWRQWDWISSQPLNRRMGRFSAIITLNKTYNFSYTSMPPLKMQFQIQKRSIAGNRSNYIIAKMKYPLPNMIRIIVNKKIIDPVVITDSGLKRNLNTSICGDNIYFYTNYTIHFVITEDRSCLIELSLTDSIRLTTHFATTTTDFFANNAISSFISKLCALLGITDTSRVKVVGVVSGSTILSVVIADVSDNSTDSNATEPTIADISTSLSSMIGSGTYSQDIQNATGYPVITTTNTLYLINPTTTEESSSFGLIIVVVVVGVVSIFAVSFAVFWHILRRRAKIMEVASERMDFSKEKEESKDQIFSDLKEENGNSCEIIEQSFYDKK